MPPTPALTEVETLDDAKAEIARLTTALQSANPHAKSLASVETRTLTAARGSIAALKADLASARETPAVKSPTPAVAATPVSSGLSSATSTASESDPVRSAITASAHGTSAASLAATAAKAADPIAAVLASAASESDPLRQQALVKAGFAGAAAEPDAWRKGLLFNQASALLRNLSQRES